jgi:peptidoglycan/LPS O-acetylase OafA/YrhL
LQANQPAHKFFPQLEGLRAMAIASVIAFHWVPAGPGWSYWLDWAGSLGVIYFYVLSGFLIGNILLREKDKLDKNNEAIGSSLIIFYCRRMLRTFPAYYLLLIILLVLKFPYDFSSVSGWFFLHLSNLYFFFYNCWDGNNTLIGHFWSLAVEEQFYLLFPLLILFVPRSFLLRAIILMGLSGMTCRVILYLIHAEYFSIFTLSCFDSFAIGALLSYVRIKEIPISLKAIKLITLIALLLYVFLPHPSFLYFTGKTFLYRLLPSGAVLCAGLIYLTTQKEHKRNYLLENSLFVYLGKIGYGLYLYHMFIPSLAVYLLKEFGYNISSAWIFVVDVILLLTVSSVSFYLLEKPVYSLKKHFRYKADVNEKRNDQEVRSLTTS